MESASEEHSSTPLSDTGGSLFSSTDRPPRRSLSEPRYLSTVGADEAPAPKPLGRQPVLILSCKSAAPPKIGELLVSHDWE